MKPHDTILQLAAVAIDFPLDAADRRRLDQHLAACQACARTAAMLRQDAVAMTHLPPVTLPERRGAEIIAAALRPAPARVTGRVLAIAVVLGLLLLGTLAVGAGLIRYLQPEELSVVPPAPIPTGVPLPASPDPSPPQASPGLVEVAAWDGAIVVTRNVDGTEWIELLVDDGSTVRLAEGRDPAWLVPGTVVFTCPAASGTRLDICAVDLAAPMTPRTLFEDADAPAPAPDGRTIAVHRGMTDVGETWLIDADGANPRLLHAGAFARWSPDGAWLAGQPESAGLEVAIVGVDGQGYRVVGPGREPAWTQWGTRLTYAVATDQGSSIVSTSVSDEGSEILVEAPADSWLRSPTWLDDSRLLFVQDGDIRMFGAPGTYQPTAVSSGAGIDPDNLGGGLALSPDGTRIAYTTGTGPGTHVVVMSIDGTGVQTELLVDSVAGQPAWGAVAPGQVFVATNPAGYAWSQAMMPAPVGRPTGIAEAVITGGPGFVAVGRGCTGSGPTCEAIVWTSVDGSRWQRVPASDGLDIGASFPTSGPEIGMFDVALGMGGFVAIGYAARPELEATVWLSPDATTWERIPLGPVDRVRVNAVEWNGGRYVIVGEDRSTLDGTAAGIASATARAAAWTSTDGRSWTRVPHAAMFEVGQYMDTMEDPSGGGMADVANGPYGVVAVGSTCAGDGRCRPAAWTMDFEGTWDRVTGLPDVTGALRAITWSDAGYVAVGTDGAVVMTSPDGRTWTPVQPFDVRGFDTVTHVGDRFIATTSEHEETVWASPDGGTWSPYRPDGGPSTNGGFAMSGRWQFAADNVTAVWLGTPEAGDPAAWVSVGQPVP